ncbi:Fanconi anemia group D2 protein homolog isoform X2 [Drosophila tropicalis]|uniref:Fanconi anemia group D2 protein homolog isoform X2 n=1 Tax=Drosophila tropicalis TaxID=46794 RepID=UPI0035AB9B11
MYRNRKRRNQKPLNAIDENDTIKIPRHEDTNKQEEKTEVSIESISSEENIPASQEHTQRFLSQHSTILAATLGRTQSSGRNGLGTSRQPNSFFELVLIRSGVQLDQGDTFVLSCDHVSIVSKLRDIFLRAPGYADKVETFKTGLNLALSPKSKMAQKLLSGCTVDAAGEEQIYQSQNSIFMNFLMIDFLREPCLEVLLNKIEEMATSEDLLSGQTVGAGISLLPLMLAQLRYMTLSHSEEIYKRIERVFNNANQSARLDIINNAEFVLDATKHDEFVDLLIINYSSNEELFHMTTVQTLSNLSLSPGVQSRLCGRILEFITSGFCPETTMPHCIRLLLNLLKTDTDESVRQLIVTLREIFSWYQSANSNLANDKKSQLELFEFLKLGLIRSQRFYQLWQRSISGLRSNAFKSFDLIMLLLLIDVNEDNSMYIENILRRRIKLEYITVEILEEVKMHYPYILEQNISILMHLLHGFMREKNRAVSDFAKSAYSMLFKIFDTIQKSILKKLLELTCDKSANHLTTTALNLLRELQCKNPKGVQNCAMLLIPLLDRLSDLTLSQTRLAMDLLCHVAFPDPKLTECVQLQEQIDMVVKKQLINRDDSVKKQGIIGCVQLVDAVGRIEPHEIQPEDFVSRVDNIDMLKGRGKMASNLIIITQSSIINNAELMALFFEELASVFYDRCTNNDNSCHLDKDLVIWLCEVMTFRFQSIFVTEDVPDTIKGIQLEYQKNINELDDSNIETETEVLKIGINISKLVLAPTNQASDSIYVMAPLFNLVSVLHNLRYQYSLESINALLGCAIVLPKFIDDGNYLAIYDNFSEDQQKAVLTIYFHTINWMRVTISAFTSQKHPATRSRVLLRLDELIHIEQKVKTLLKHAPLDFVPPPYQFLSNAKQMGAKQTNAGARTLPAGQGEHNETALANQSTLPDMTMRLGPCKTIKNKIDFEHLYSHQEKYRPMGAGIIILLVEQKFTLNYPLESDQVGHFLGLSEFRFLLVDLVQKLEAAVLGQRTDTTDVDCQLLHVSKPEYLINDLHTCLPEVNKNLIILAKAIDEQMAQVNNVYSNLDLFKEKFNYVKACFGLCIRLFALYFAWNEWTEKSHADLLHKSLYTLMPADQWKTLRKQTVSKVATQIFDYFIKYEKSVLTLSTTVQLHRLVCSLRKLSDSDESSQPRFQQAEETRDLCEKFLRRKWFDFTGHLEKGSQCNIYLDELVKGFLKSSLYDRQKNLLHALKQECMLLNTKDKSLNSYPNFKKANFPILFRGVCEVLINTFSAQLGVDTDGDRFKLWESTVDLLNGLLNIVQKVEQPRNFSLFLKHSLMFLKQLLQHGMPLLETIVREDPTRLTKFLHELQNVTRFLHQLCCHSKVIKNTAIISYIPSLRETIEVLVFRVKALLAANNCHSAFHMGNMINRDLHGDAITTPVGSIISEENSDEEIPEDDASVDETIMTDEMAGITTADISSSSVRPSTSGGSRSKSSSRSKCF